MGQHGGNNFQGMGSGKTNPTRSRFSALLNRGARSAQITDDEEAFFVAGYQAAAQAGCEFLFEIPPVLLEQDADRAAAIRCERDGVKELFFLVFDAKKGLLNILEEDRVSAAVLDFTLSYAGVLCMIAADTRVFRTHLH